MSKQTQILFADDLESFRMAICELLGAFHHVTDAASFSQAKELILDETRSFDIAILDKNFPDGDGRDLVRLLKEHRPETGIIMLTADHEQRSAKECLEAGAHDYVVKSSTAVADLVVRIQMLLSRLATDRKIGRLVSLLQEGMKYELVGPSSYVTELREKIQAQKGAMSPVLITGESGTGKELIARRIHAVENDATRPFVVVNCGAIPANLIESELFGHEKGAFTGAFQKRIGKFELADEGDIFLDEIGELPIALQATLLRVLQDGEFYPVGAMKPKKVNVRVIAATNRNLEKEVSDGRFRQDLFYRLSVIRFATIPLRERTEDIESLVISYLSKKLQGDRLLTRDSFKKLKAYHWPGNIRELQNTIERALVSARQRKSARVDSCDIHFDLAPVEKEDLSYLLPQRIEDITPERLNEAKRELEGVFISKALSVNNYNVALAAKQLGMSRSSLHNKINDMNIPLRPSKADPQPEHLQ